MLRDMQHGRRQLQQQLHRCKGPPGAPIARGEPALGWCHYMW
jgi:hypothetical protein